MPSTRLCHQLIRDLPQYDEPMLDYGFPDQRKEYFEEFLQDHDIHIPQRYLTPLICTGYIDPFVKFILKVHGIDFDDDTGCIKVPNPTVEQERECEDIYEKNLAERKKESKILLHGNTKRKQNKNKTSVRRNRSRMQLRKR